MSSLEGLRSIANDLAAGFEALLDRVEAQKRIERDLREKLATVASRYNSNISDNPSDVALSDWQDEIVKQISPQLEKANLGDYHWAPDNDIYKAKKAVHSLKSAMASPGPKRCPVAHINIKAADDEMEKDFTTQGKPSDLSCPFAKANMEGSLDLTQLRDPIAAEFHPDVKSAVSIGDTANCNICPIRFLDKHSPEEIAQYFENHKHEIPRSHEICVKRYQRNEHSIRELDARYGNLVSMIQGLGNKHKQYLPSEEQGDASANDQNSSAAVQKWAQHVHDGQPQQAAEVSNLNQIDNGPEDENIRTSRFDKPLRDIRVGESPSRPWGISVPVDRAAAPSAIVSEHPQEKPTSLTAANIEQSKKKPSVRGAQSARSKSSMYYSDSRSRGGHRPSKVVFNGPNFFGYTPEQASAFLSQLTNT